MAGSLLVIDATWAAPDALERFRRMLSVEQWEKAQRSAVRYAAKAAQVAIAKGVTEKYSLPSRRIKEDISAPQFVKGGDEAWIRIRRKPPSAVAYGGRDPGRRGRSKNRGKGLSVAVFRGGPRQPVPRGFIIRTGRLAGRPFARINDARDSRLRFVYGPSVGSIFAGQSRFGEQIRATVNTRIEEQYSKGLQRSFDSLARGYG